MNEETRPMREAHALPADGVHPRSDDGGPVDQAIEALLAIEKRQLDYHEIHEIMGQRLTQRDRSTLADAQDALDNFLGPTAPLAPAG